MECVHGQLARSCTLCELESEIERLKAELDEGYEINRATMTTLTRVIEERNKWASKCGSARGELAALKQASDGRITPFNTLNAASNIKTQPQVNEPVGYITHSGMSAYINAGLNLDDDTPLYLHPAPSDRDAWQPIETAPKDETVIILGLPAIGVLRDASSRRVYEGRWHSDQQTFTSVNGFILLTGATHWMPLPAAPAIDAAMEGGK